VLTRRSFLESCFASVLLFHINNLSFAQDAEEVFPQGIASGDPTQTGAILWTRVNPAVHKKMNRDLILQISEEPDFKRAFTGRIPAGSINVGDDFTVRIDLDGKLQPGKTYYYRFIYADVPSMVGRFRTLPERAEEFSLAFVVCQNYADGYYTAYRHLAQEDVHFVVHLGDFIYEKIYGPARVPGRDLRMPSGEDICVNLEDYRYLYRTYLSDPDFRLARAMHPFIATWDDHEFLNDHYFDYHRGTWGYFTKHPFGGDREKILRLRQEALKAWLEYVPARVKTDFGNRDPLSWITIYRDFDLGGLGHLIVTDLRSYKDRPPCEGRFGVEGCREQFRTSMLGADQKRWFFSKLAEGSYRWKVWASSVQLSRSMTDGRFGSLDAWDGYAGERQQVLDFLKEKGMQNLIAITGDRHASLVAEIPDSYEKPERVLGAEFMTPAVSSINANEGGWWRRSWSYPSLEDFQRAEMAQNQWIKHINSINCWGYSVLTLGREKAECTIYSVNKYRRDADKKIDARFFYSGGLLERA
jgi:alkaline phosphatase D